MFCLKPISLWLTLIFLPNARKCDYSAHNVKLSQDNAYIDHDKVVSDDKFLILDSDFSKTKI